MISSLRRPSLLQQHFLLVGSSNLEYAGIGFLCKNFPNFGKGEQIPEKKTTNYEFLF